MIEEKVKFSEDFWSEVEILDSRAKGNFNVKTKKDEELRRLLDKVELNKIESGSLVKATYMGLKGNNHIFSVPNLKDDLWMDNKPVENKYLINTKVGDKIDVIITKVEDSSNYLMECSISALYESKAHQSLQSLEDDTIIKIIVKSLNPAGYDLDIMHGGVTLKGFMPNTLAGVNKLYNPESLVGMELNAMVESYSDDEGTYIVSRRRYIESLIPDEIEKLNTSDVYTGWVTGTTPFGVFVEFNECLTGMVHKANINPEWADKLDQIKPGTQIDFYIKEIIKNKNPKKSKIILTQILRDSIWDSIQPGQFLIGKVVDNKPFGVLISLDDETMGLIHQSELDKLGIKNLDKDKQVKVKVLHLDRQTRKIFLTHIK